MNYRHSYHAGNFSDVLKQLVVLALVETLQKKPSPFCYIETHAGRGLYDLRAAEAEKTKEHQNGIQKIAAHKGAPDFVQKYLKWIQDLNATIQSPPSLTLSLSSTNATRYFPGTAWIVQGHLREKDRLVLAELHSEEHGELKKLFHHTRQTAVHHMNGYQALKAFLPPKEKRGLVLVDPPYEATHETDLITTALTGALQKWPQGIFAIWYPIKEPADAQKLRYAFSRLPAKTSAHLELLPFPDAPLRLRGCGMWILNPPWQFDQEISPWMEWLISALRAPAKISVTTDTGRATKSSLRARIFSRAWQSSS